MPIRIQATTSLAQSVRSFHFTYGDPTIPEDDYHDLMDAADKCYTEIIGKIDWSRAIIEAVSIHLESDCCYDPDFEICPSCLRKALMNTGRGYGQFASIPPPDVDWVQIFKEQRDKT